MLVIKLPIKYKITTKHISLLKLYTEYKKYLGQGGTLSAGFPQTFNEFTLSLNADRLWNLFDYAKVTYSNIPANNSDFLLQISDQLPPVVLNNITKEVLLKSVDNNLNNFMYIVNLLQLGNGSILNKMQEYKNKLKCVRSSIASSNEYIVDYNTRLVSSYNIKNKFIYFMLIMLIIAFPVRYFVMLILWSFKVLKNKC